MAKAYITFRASGELARAITELASAECRTVSQTAELLVAKALELGGPLVSTERQSKTQYGRR